MIKVLPLFLVSSLIVIVTFGQKNIKSDKVPSAVKSALLQKHSGAKNVTWELEKGNYEANWGGKSKEDNSVVISPSGNIVETMKAIPVSELPQPVIGYIKQHYKGSKITEAGKVTDAHGKISYEAEVKKKDIIFDERGSFVKVED